MSLSRRSLVQQGWDPPVGAIARAPVATLQTQNAAPRALAAQRLMYTAELLCGVYHTAAVLFPHDSSAATVIRVLQRPDAYLANMPSRLLGRVAFRNKMLGRYGAVVTIPYKQGRSSVESMAGVIKAAVEGKTRLPLDSFCR
ncbi:hypothetical protein ABBQ32_000841 [Trebouxia sp. C0010 RCD-2024]